MQTSNSLFIRLGLIIISLFTISAFVASWFSTHYINAAMFEQSKMHLEAALKSRATIVEDHFRLTQMQVGNLAENLYISDAIQAFSEGFENLENEFAGHGVASEQIDSELAAYYETEFASRFDREIDASDYLPVSSLERIAQWIYIAKNPNSVGNKNEAYTPSIEISYQYAHDQYHNILNKYLKSFDFYDIFLFDRNARLVYSSKKETDFATNFNNGPYARSNLGHAARASLASAPNAVITSDLENYTPSYDEPAAFFAAPVFSDSQLIGAVAFQISNERINRVVADKHGLRGTGETYIVGGDLLMRTDSRFTDTSTILTQKVDTEAARAVISGETGSTVNADYRGISVLSQYRPLNIDGLNWGMLAEIDEAEVRQPSKSLTQRLVAILIATLAAVAAITYILFKFGVQRPLANISFTAKRIIDGDYSARTPVNSNDEFSQLAQSQNQMAEAVQTHINKLEAALREVRELRGLLPICAYCKSIRDDDGYFRTVETYLVVRSNLEFTHTYCDQCLSLHHPESSEKLVEN